MSSKVLSIEEAHAGGLGSAIDELSGYFVGYYGRAVNKRRTPATLLGSTTISESATSSLDLASTREIFNFDGWTIRSGNS